MARPKRLHEKTKVCTELEKYEYDYLKKQADKHGYSVAEAARRVICFFVEKQFPNTVVASLPEEQEKQLYVLANKKGKSAGEMASAIITAYLEIP